jgi:ferredoxin-NADP reductase
MKAKLVARKEVADGTLGFVLEPAGKFPAFVPGQFCDLTLPAPPFSDDKGDIRTLSIASSPREGRLLFATRLTGSAFKRSLAEGPLGLEVEVEGPFGSFALHDDPARPAVLLAGGIGITPYRSMIADAAERADPRRITLIYSNRRASSVAFLEDFERWEREAPGFRLVATLTDPEAGKPWPRETGRVDREFLKRFLPGNEEAVWYAVGPDGFIGGMEMVLPEIGIPPERIRVETFAGY